MYLAWYSKTDINKISLVIRQSNVNGNYVSIKQMLLVVGNCDW